MHGDHSGNNAKFISKAVTLIAHENTRESIKTNQHAKLAKK